MATFVGGLFFDRMSSQGYIMLNCAAVLAYYIYTHLRQSHGSDEDDEVNDDEYGSHPCQHPETAAYNHANPDDAHRLKQDDEHDNPMVLHLIIGLACTD
mmetsp:Transcript_14064/g.23389  ORF Transcript_14064/g.23389 Transcript_14064/m.23389 type:complete len:99 (-) Transcript_14064:2226-2522(-)